MPLQFSPEQVTQFEKQYTEGYDVPDPNYLAWKNIHHPSPESVAATASDSPTSVSLCGAKSTTTATSADFIVSVSPSLLSSEEVVSKLLVVRKTGRTRSAINQKAIEISNSTNLQEMKDKEQAKADAKTLREERKLERQEKKKSNKKERRRRSRKKKERQKQNKEKVKENRKPRIKDLNVPHQVQRYSWFGVFVSSTKYCGQWTMF